MRDLWRDETFKGTRVECYDGWVNVTVPGYRPFQAVAENTGEYRMRAFALGFVKPDMNRDMDAADAMNYEHDRAHAFMAEVLGLDVSPTLLWVARGRDENDLTEQEFVRDAEEQFILAYHRYRNALMHAGLWPEASK